LHQHWNPKQTAACVWPDCRLETDLFFGARQTAAVGRQHSSRIGFSVAADIDSNVVPFYFLVWSLSRLFCFVGSGSSVATALDRVANGISNN